MGVPGEVEHVVEVGLRVVEHFLAGLDLGVEPSQPAGDVVLFFFEEVDGYGPA